jgi:hypothetical protein
MCVSTSGRGRRRAHLVLVGSNPSALPEVIHSRGLTLERVTRRPSGWTPLPTWADMRVCCSWGITIAIRDNH